MRTQTPLDHLARELSLDHIPTEEEHLATVVRYDVTRLFDHEFTSMTEDPLPGTHSGDGQRLTRDEYARIARQRVHAANVEHWGARAFSDGNGNVTVDASKLPAPPAVEAKKLVVSDLVKILGREAAHVRAYVARLDREVQLRDEGERQEHRERLERQVANFEAADDQRRQRLALELEESREGHARHLKRLADQHAHERFVSATQDLASFASRAESARRELEALDRSANTDKLLAEGKLIAVPVPIVRSA